MRASSLIQRERASIRSSRQSIRRATKRSRRRAGFLYLRTVCEQRAEWTLIAFKQEGVNMSEVNRKLGGALVGIGGITAALALLCCVAPWLLAGFLVALGLGFLLKDILLLAIAALGLLVALCGFWLRRRRASGHG